MEGKIIRIIYLIVSLSVVCALPAYADDPIWREALARFSSMVEANQVEKVRVLRVPDRLETLAGVSPDSMEVLSSYKCTTILNQKMLSDLLTALKSVRVVSRDKPADVRWGAIFFDKDDQVLFKMYFDGFKLFRSTRDAILNNSYVESSPELVDWLERNFPEATCKDGKK